MANVTESASPLCRSAFCNYHISRIVTRIQNPVKVIKKIMPCSPRSFKKAELYFHIVEYFAAKGIAGLKGARNGI